MTSECNHEQKLRTIIHSNQQIRETLEHNVNSFLGAREDLLENSGIQRSTAYNDVLAPLIEGSRIEQIKARILSDRVQLAFCGGNSCGKSAFIHTFLGIGKILPSGDGPITARLTKLTYAPGEQARIYIRKSLRDQTLDEAEVDLSTFFTGERPKWMDVAKILSIHLKRPSDKEETSTDFAQWARCIVEVHIPSPILALGIDVYDTPGFLLDDARVLKEILHDLVELIHPTIVFMYDNPSTDDATKSCFLAMKAALHDLDSTSIFFLNSKADISQMSKFKQNMNVDQFFVVLTDERTRRYALLLRAPFLANNALEGLPTTAEECRYFDICSVNSQVNKPCGPLMNETTIQRIIQFVANKDLVQATYFCKLILPIIDAFFYMLTLTRYRSPEQLLQLHYDAKNWGEKYFEAYTIYTENCLKDLLSSIFQQFTKEEESIVRPFLRLRKTPDSLERTVQAAVRLQVITPAIRESIRKFMSYVFEHIVSNSDLTQGAVFNQILDQALGRQEISDFAMLLLGDQAYKRPVDVSILYMINTISTPILQCAQSLLSLDFSTETMKAMFLEDKEELSQGRRQSVESFVREHLLIMQAIIEKQVDTMRQAIKLWGDYQRAVLESIIEAHYTKFSPLHHSHQETLTYLERYIQDFIIIECKLRAVQDTAKFSDGEPRLQSGEESKSTLFSIFTADWGTEKNLVVKKLSQPLLDQPNAVFYEAHYHLKAASLRHPNIINLRYLYEHHLDDQTSELWMIFPPMISTLEEFLQRPNVLISIETVMEWMSRLVDALASLHQNELVHGNVILSNILITDDAWIMLADWGDWNENCDVSVRHSSLSTLNSTNDDMKGFGEIGLFLNGLIQHDTTISGVIEELYDLMLKCSQASQATPVTAEFALEKLRFMLGMC